MKFQDSDIYSGNLELKYSTFSSSDTATALIIYLFSIASFTKEPRPYSRAIVRDFLMRDKIKIRDEFSDSDFFFNVVKLSVNMGIFPISAIQPLSFYLYDIKTRVLRPDTFEDEEFKEIMGLLRVSLAVPDSRIKRIYYDYLNGEYDVTEAFKRCYRVIRENQRISNNVNELMDIIRVAGLRDYYQTINN